MDIKTLSYYDTNAGQVTDLYEAADSTLLEYANAYLPAGSRVLDVGFGSGRDLATLLQSGHEAYGVEPSSAMVASAILRHPELANRVAVGGLPEMGLSGERFDGVFAWASLMHVPLGEMKASVRALCETVAPQGYLMVSISVGRRELSRDHRDPAGRLFSPIAPAKLTSDIADNGLGLVAQDTQHDTLGRDISWWVGIFRKGTANGGISVAGDYAD